MRLLAALTFFTRLPFWRIRQIPADAFKRVVPFWPLTGWLTGFTIALVIWLASQVMPLTLAWILAIVARLLLTGCLHEDGLADFIDGFGGGNSRERRLTIMKDSHIGTYGVIGLIVYFVLILQLPSVISRDTLCMLVLCGDYWAKCCAAQLINLLSYARTEEEAKNKTVYERMNWWETLICVAAGLLPAYIMIFVLHWLPVSFCWLMLAPVAVMFLLALLMKRKIQGYTGDCCGATFLLCELSLYLATLIAFPFWD
ncbi:MAG: adenosylcobinamide-GDP ribazoletransferase [Bacteroidales bacterium]|nr:adenosylcobinamide-GDP ribazoletransferase [Bacteroidales bacterium]